MSGCFNLKAVSEAYQLFVTLQQLKLQQQNMRLAPPLSIPGKRMEDSGTTSEDDGLPRSPPEMSFQEVAMQRGTSKVNLMAQSNMK